MHRSVRITRRRFLQTSSLATIGATVAISGTNVGARVIGSNDRIHVAVAGINGRGTSHIGEYTGMKDRHNVQVSTLIDPDKRLFTNKAKLVNDRAGNEPACITDFREALDDKNIDAISIATTNHWHAPMTIYACMAGKDVYVEKPCSHNVHEGRVAVQAARKYNRIVQHGTQNRASNRWAQLAEYAADGSLGKLKISRGLCYKRRSSIGIKPHAQPPKDFDWNLWLGPAQEQPFHGNLVHYNWHWFWDFGNGDIGNQGVHEMDKARWMIPGATLPRRILSLGGRFGYTDQAQVPNTQIAFFDYGPDKPMILFEVRGLSTKSHLTQMVGNVMHFEAGTVAGQGTYTPADADKPAPLPKVEEKKRVGGGQFTNFIMCMRSRKTEDLNADILEGHYSSALCHLANISHRLGEDAPFSKQSNAIGDNREIVEMFDRMKDHLKDNQVNLDETDYRVGKMLEFDPEKEKFVNDKEADALLTREYRAPFTIPDKL